ncbi:MAG: hypothetical protein ABSF38_15535 [Verrucomicrobiota bacterium]
MAREVRPNFTGERGSFSVFEMSRSPLSRGPLHSFQRFSFSAFPLLFWLSLSLFETACAQTNVTPWQWLASQSPPNFAPGNTLPYLTWNGWDSAPSTNTMMQLASNWDYELPLDLHNLSLAQNLTSQPGMTYIALASNYPNTFKISVILNIIFPTPIPTDFWVTNSSGYFVDNNSNTWTALSNPNNYSPIVSPQADQIYYTNAFSNWAFGLATINSNAPVATVLIDGEFGLGVPATCQNSWAQDPRVIAASPGPLNPTNTIDWFTYCSIRKSNEIVLLANMVRAAVPNRQLYSYYSTYDEALRTGPLWETSWGFNDQVTSNCTDFPAYQSYYQGWPGANWTNGPNAQYYGQYDLLTQYLNCVGFHLAFPQPEPLSYDWESGGWDTTVAGTYNSPIPLYMGFLKCCYTAGMIGGNAGCYALPTNGVNPLNGINNFDVSFPAHNPPFWLAQMVALSQVHALFTHLENFLRNGSLLPGPYQHVLSSDQPAYEFTPRTMPGSNDRVLVRQLNNSNLWLACAWATDGVNTNVTVTIPTLGAVTLLARDCGAVYEMTTANSTLVDVNGLLPTATFAEATPPTNLHVVSGSTNQQKQK